MSKDREELTKVTGLWKNKGKDGKTFLSGKFGMAFMLVYPNRYKKKEKEPDYYVCLRNDKKRPEQKKEENSGAEEL